MDPKVGPNEGRYFGWRWCWLSSGARFGLMRVASLTRKGTGDSLLESSSSTSEVAFGTVGRRFR